MSYYWLNASWCWFLSISDCGDDSWKDVFCSYYTIPIITKMMIRDTWHLNNDVAMMFSYTLRHIMILKMILCIQRASALWFYTWSVHLLTLQSDDAVLWFIADNWSSHESSPMIPYSVHNARAEDEYRKKSRDPHWKTKMHELKRSYSPQARAFIATNKKLALCKQTQFLKPCNIYRTSNISSNCDLLPEHAVPFPLYPALQAQ